MGTSGSGSASGLPFARERTQQQQIVTIATIMTKTTTAPTIQNVVEMPKTSDDELAALGGAAVEGCGVVGTLPTLAIFAEEMLSAVRRGSLAVFARVTNVDALSDDCTPAM